MKTLKELKEIAIQKGLNYEINVFDPVTRMKRDITDPEPKRIEIGIEYKPWIYAWYYTVLYHSVTDVEEQTMFFKWTYNMNVGRTDQSYKRGMSVERQLFK